MDVDFDDAKMEHVSLSQKKEKYEVLNEFCRIRYRYKNANDLQVKFTKTCDGIVNSIKGTLKDELEANQYSFFLSSGKFKDYLNDKIPFVEKECFARCFEDMSDYTKFIHDILQANQELNDD